LVVSTNPSEKYEFVSCDYEIPAIYGKSFKSHVPVTTNKWLVWPLTNSLHTKRSPLSLFEVLLAVAIWWFLQYQPLTPGRTATFLLQKRDLALQKKKYQRVFPVWPRNSSCFLSSPRYYSSEAWSWCTRLQWWRGKEPRCFSGAAGGAPRLVIEPPIWETQKLWGWGKCLIPLVVQKWFNRRVK
jgi:hypothetical protein